MISWIFYYNLILQSFIASVIVIYGLDDHYMIKRAGDTARFYGWLAIQYTMIAMPLGMLLTTYAFGYKSNIRLFKNYLTTNLSGQLSVKDSYVRMILYGLSLLSILSVIYVLASLNTIPIIGVVKGLGKEVLAMQRTSAAREFGGIVYVRNIFALGLTPILTYISFSYWKMTKNKMDFVWFLFLFLASFFILTYSIAKGPFITFLFGFIFLNVLVNGKIKKSTLIIFFGFAFLLLVLLYIFVAKVVDPKILFSFNTGIGGRILLTQSQGTFLSFEVFPKMVDHIGFHSVSNFLNQIFGIVTHERSARVLAEIYNPMGIEAGTTGVINSLFVAEGWANFGIVGVILSPLYVGAIIQSLFMSLISMRKTPLTVGLMTYFSYKSSVTGGLNDYFFSAKSIFLVLTCVAVYFVSLFFKKINTRIS